MRDVRKRLCLLLVLALVLGLWGCGKGPEEAGTVSAAPEEAASLPSLPAATEDMSAVISLRVESREEVFPLASGTYIRDMARSGGKLLLLAESEEGGSLALAGYSIDGDGRPTLAQAAALEAAPLPFEEARYCAVSAGGDGNFYLLAGNSLEGAATALCVQQYSPEGEFMAAMEIPDWELMTVDLFCFGNGEFILATDGVVCLYRWMEGLVRRSDSGLALQSGSLSGPGLVLSGYSDADHRAHFLLADSESGELSELDLSGMEPSGPNELDRFLSSGSLAPCQSLGNEYLINDGEAICQVDLENGHRSQLIEWCPEMDVNASPGKSCRLGDEAFACLSDGRLYLAWAHDVEKRESGLVRVGVVEVGYSASLSRGITRLNTADSPYIFQVDAFTDDEAGLDKFRAELAAGAFDLVVFHHQIDTSASGFEDLYPYIDRDPDLSREDFMPNLLESSTVKGELHQLWNSVSVSTLAAREEVVGDGRGLSAADCRELVNSRDDLQSVLDNKFSDVNGLRQDTLQNVAIMGAAVFVDKDNASCSFDSAEFAELLSLCKSIEANPDSSGDDFLLNSAGFDLSWLEERLGPCSFVGYPDGGDGLHFYILPNDFTYAVTMAIPTGSQNKEGAWYYIKSKLSRSSQLKLANEGRGLLPVMYEPAQDFISQNFEADQAQSIFGLLERTKYSELYGDSVLRDMIIDSSQAYLAGSKSLEETVQLIQGKASVYVAERYA